MIAQLCRHIGFSTHATTDIILATINTGEFDYVNLHWYFVIVPRISTPAGFEIGSGIYINTMLPEDSARFLRKTSVAG